MCVPKSVTGGSDLYVPYAWFAGYPSFVALSTTYANCLGLGKGGYFVISGDNDSDDNAMYWADVKVYDGIVDP